MTKKFEVAAYGSPEENEGVPNLLQFREGFLSEEEVPQAVEGFFSASPIEALGTGEPVAPVVEVWKVAVREVGDDGYYASENGKWFSIGEEVSLG